MARLLQVFGFLSVLFRGATLTFQSLAIGGIAFFIFIVLPAPAIIGSAVMTSHSMARLEYRVPLVAFTALHQAATAAWLGGLPYLLIAIRRAPTPQFARELSARFSKLALVSVAVLGCAG